VLDRSNNCVEITEEGRRFLFESKKLLAMSGEMIEAAKGTVGSSPTCAMHGT
jgi:DNA-binding transcriptional LysR family regulator